MYETIGQATQSTIEPATKDVRIETVMGKLEGTCKFLSTVGMFKKGD